MKTGSLDAVKKVKLAGNDAQENEALAKSITQGIEQKTWYVDPSAWYELKESQPAIMSDGNLLFKSVYTFDYGAESVANGEIKPVKEEERVSTQDCDFRGRYNPTTKSWELNLWHEELGKCGSKSCCIGNGWSLGPCGNRRTGS